MAERTGSTSFAQAPRADFGPGDSAVGALDLDIDSLFVGEWRPVRPSPLYLVSLCITGLVMAVLPILYLAIVAALIGFALWHFGVEMPEWIEGTGRLPGRAGTMRGVLFATPAIGALAMAIFMLKPLFAPLRNREDRYTLSRDQEPRLHAFVDSLCDRIGAPRPTRIDVTAEVNASVSFRRGLLSVFTPADCVLTIGMPLAAGMSIPQFGGIIAHEMGHIRQGAGMRIGYLIAVVNSWFVRAAFERDGWDAGVDNWMRHSSGVLALCGWFVKCAVGLGRLVLMLVALMAHVIMLILSRQKEHNADDYMVRVAGPVAFERSHNTLLALAAAFGEAAEETRTLYEQTKPHQLHDDIPSLVADHATRVKTEDFQKHRIERRASERGLFLSHPPTESRIKRALRSGEQGILRADMPASLLFHNFEGACRTATYGLFKEAYGEHFYNATMIPTAEIIGPRAREVFQRKVLVKFLGFEPPSWRPFFPSISSLPDEADPKALVERIKRAKAILKELSPAAHAAADRFRVDSEQLVRFEQAKAVMDAKLKVNFKLLNMLPTSRAAMSDQTDVLRTRLVADTDAIESALEAAQARLASTLALLSARAAESRLQDAGVRRARALQLLEMLHGLRVLLPDCRELREDMARAEAVVRALTSDRDLEATKPHIRKLADAARDRMMAIRETGGATPYPYANVENAANLGHRLVGATPGWREFADIFSAGSRVATRYVQEQQRAIAELVEIAAGIEHDLARSAKAEARRE